MCIYISQEYIYIYKVAKDPMSHESPLRFQNAILSKFHLQHTTNHSRQSSTDRIIKIQQDHAKIVQQSFPKVCYADKRCR